jgi:hypothetical protein
VLYTALDHGVYKGKLHFRESGIGINQEKQAFSSLVRLQTKDYLKRRNLESAELEHTNLCGIWLHIGEYHLKVWRISDEDLEKAKVGATVLFDQFLFSQDGESNTADSSEGLLAVGQESPFDGVSSTSQVRRSEGDGMPLVHSG